MALRVRFSPCTKGMRPTLAKRVTNGAFMLGWLCVIMGVLGKVAPTIWGKMGMSAFFERPLVSISRNASDYPPLGTMCPIVEGRDVEMAESVIEDDAVNENDTSNLIAITESSLSYFPFLQENDLVVVPLQSDWTAENEWMLPCAHFIRSKDKESDYKVWFDLQEAGANNRTSGNADPFRIIKAPHGAPLLDGGIFPLTQNPHIKFVTTILDSPLRRTALTGPPVWGSPRRPPRMPIQDAPTAQLSPTLVRHLQDVDHTEKWLPYRNEPNVLLLSQGNNMDDTVEVLSNFLGVPLTGGERTRVVQQCKMVATSGDLSPTAATGLDLVIPSINMGD